MRTGVLLALAAAVVLGPAAAAPPPWLPTIVFVRVASPDDPAEGGAIYGMDVDGRHVQRLADRVPPGAAQIYGYHSLPSWAPDGRRFVYTAGGPTLGVEAPGKMPRIIRTRPSRDEQYSDPVWSPDGRLLAFELLTYHDSGHEGSPIDNNIGVVHPDGRGLRVLPAEHCCPRWSPRSDAVAYWDSDADSSIRVVSARGGQSTLVAAGATGPPSWSTTNRIAFPTAAGVTVVSPNGRGAQLVARVRNPDKPVWSPDGRMLAFSGRVGLYVVHADDTGLRRIVPTRTDPELSWSPDSKRIAFARARGIWIVGADGRGLKRLTHGNDHGPTWRPR